MASSPSTDVRQRFSDIWNSYQPYIKKPCDYKLGSMPDCADDCVQETFKALLAALLGGVEISNPCAWLCSVANRKISDICEREKRETHALMQISGTASLTCPGAAEESFQPCEKELEAATEAILGSLSEEERLLLTERYSLNMKTAEIAAFHKTTDNNIRQQLFRLRKKTEALIRNYITQHNM